MTNQTTNLKIGSTYTIKGREATITKMGSGKVWYQGLGFGGSASEKYFRSMMPATPTSIAQLPTPPSIRTHSKVVVPKKTLNVATVGSGAKPTRAEYTAMWKAGIITTKQFQQTLAGMDITITPPSKTATSNATAPAGEPHKDTSLLKLTKKGSTKFYIIICIILGIIIFAEGKIFKKVIK